MGIYNLFELLEAYGIKGEEVKDFTLVEYSPIIIDAYPVIYRALKVTTVKALTDKNGAYTAHLKNALDLVIKLYINNASSIWVFDGKPPLIKDMTITKRNEAKEKAAEELAKINDFASDLSEFLDDEDLKQVKISEDTSKLEKKVLGLGPEVINPLKEMLGYLGVPTVQSPEEADVMIKQLCSMGLSKTTSAYSTDSDMLVFGCERLLRPYVDEAKKKRYWKSYRLGEILSKMNITREELVIIAICLGCDYVTKVKGVGIETIKKKIADKSISSLKAKFDEEQMIAYNRFLNPPQLDLKVEITKHDFDKLEQFLVDRDFKTAKKYIEKLTSLQFNYSKYFAV
jgi:flap endonuclease-1